ELEIFQAIAGLVKPDHALMEFLDVSDGSLACARTNEPCRQLLHDFQDLEDLYDIGFAETPDDGAPRRGVLNKTFARKGLDSFAQRRARYAEQRSQLDLVDTRSGRQ